jgi:hypothetical protein
MLVSAPGLWNFCFTLHLLCLYLHYELLEILPLAMTRRLRLLAFVAVCTAEGVEALTFNPHTWLLHVDLGHVPASLLLLRLPLDS